MKQLEGMKAIVTGGAQGIGAGICAGLAAAGASVAIVDKQIDKATETAALIAKENGTVIAITADLSSDEGCRQAVERAVAELGGVDILINNAAPGRNRDMIGKLTGTDWDIHHQVVLSAVVALTDAAADFLAVNGNGAVVNISSVTAASVAVDQCSWPYHVSKAGLDQLTRWLAVRMGGRGIRVNAIAPGLVDRDVGPKLTDNQTNKAIIDAIVPLGRAGSAHDITQAVVFLCSRQAAYITGQVLVVDGGLGLSEVFGASLRAFNKAGQAN